MYSESDEMKIPITLERSLTVSEIFGRTIQGEGPSQGRTVVFLRLGLCNLDCSWCDTPYTWDWTGKNGVKYDKDKELTRMTVREVVDQLVNNYCAGIANRVVISGGEPLIQQKSLAYMITSLYTVGITCEIETNGTITPSNEMLNLAEIGAVSFNCSPKLANSGVSETDRVKPEALTALKHAGAIFKFVVSDINDIDEIQQYLDTHLTDLDPQRVYIMPEGTTRDKIIDNLRWTFNAASAYGWSLSPRLHVLAFNDMRGI